MDTGEGPLHQESATLKESEIAARTRDYLRENFLYMRPDWKLGDDDPLLGTGVLDSIGVVELVAFLQAEFACEVEEEDLTERNLGTVTAIARFVHGKCHGNGNGASRRPPPVI